MSGSIDDHMPMCAALNVAPTPEQIQEWWRLLRRHGPDTGAPPTCLSCGGAPHPCAYHLSARAALLAAAAAIEPT